MTEHALPPTPTPDSSNGLAHTSVLYHECLEALELAPHKIIVDATMGGGGHTAGIAQSGARTIGFDQDPEAIRRVSERGIANLTLVQDNFAQLKSRLDELGIAGVDGILADLGVSSFHFDDAERGFSYQNEGPLDMRMDKGLLEDTVTAAEVINEFDAQDIVDILRTYGEEHHANRIVRFIMEHRPILTTTQLADVVRRATGFRESGHPARKTFQALRIYVNDELGVLKSLLQAAETVLNPGGKLVLISFHSLEDRIIKHFIRDSKVLEQTHKKPILPTEEEQAHNPRSRSAKLRVAQKVAP